MSEDFGMTASITPRAVAILTGLLELRSEPNACEVYNGGAIWRLTHGIVVELRLDDDGAAHWAVTNDG